MDARTIRALIPFAVVADGAVIAKVFVGYTDLTLTALAVLGWAVCATAGLVYYYRTR